MGWNYKKGNCNHCGAEDVYIVKSSAKNGKYCNECNVKRLSENKESIKSTGGIVVQQRTFNKKGGKGKTGEGELFRELLKTRERVSFVSGEPLDSWDLRFMQCMAHVISKSKCPNFILNPENIQFLKAREHSLYDNPVTRDQLREDPQWSKLFALEKKLVLQYAQLYGNGAIHKVYRHYLD